MTLNPITFAVAVNDQATFENNFLISPCFRGNHLHEVIVQKGFESAAKAYNDALNRAGNDLIVFAHQDIIFPAGWLADLEASLKKLANLDPHWGVLGCYGMTADHNNRGYIYSQGMDIMGNPAQLPAPVQTLDEIVLILRKSSGLRFDERVPGFHFYGAEICLAAAKRGMKSYAISAFCIHNSQLNLVLPKEFYQAYHVVKRLWKNYLPIQTTCIRITRFDKEMYIRKLKDPYLRHIRRKTIEATRVKDGRRLLRELAHVAPANTSVATEGGRCACR